MSHNVCFFVYRFVEEGIQWMIDRQKGKRISIGLLYSNEKQICGAMLR
jgi:hypothetical protein